MEGMDIDQVVEVPDTPDRPTTGHVTAGDFGGKASNLLTAGCSQSSISTNEESLNRPRIRGRLVNENGHNRKLNMHHIKSSSRFNKTEQCSNSISFHPEDIRHGSQSAGLFMRKAIDKNYKHKTRTIGGPHGDSGKQICSKVPSESFGSQDHVDLTGKSRHAQMPEMVKLKDLSAKEIMEGQTAANGGSSHWPPNFPKMPVCSSKGKEKVGYGTSKDPDFVSRHGNVIDLSGGGQHDTDRQVYASRQSSHSPTIKWQKKLVRNGCISPHNIESKAKQLAGHSRNYSKDVERNHSVDVVPYGPGTIDIGDIVAESDDLRTSKGKRKHHGMSEEHEQKFFHLSSSSASNHGEVNANGHAGPWRTTHNHLKNVDHPLPNSVGLHSGRNNDLGEISRRGQVANTVTERTKKHVLRLRYRGQSSRTSYEDKDIVYLGSSGKSSSRSLPSRSQSRRNQCTMSTADFSPQMRNSESQGLDYCSNDDAEAIARQLEADELLALELQEQLYHESPVFGSGEIDENLARALQQEDDAFRTSIGNHHLLHSIDENLARALQQEDDAFRTSIGNHHLLHSRNTSSSSRQHQSRVLLNASNRRRARTRVQNSTGGTQIRSRLFSRSRAAPSRGRNLRFPLEMDLEMRQDLLEALEEAFGEDMETVGNFRQFQRELNENDYEMLLALDDNIHQSGASASQINSLPVSSVQTDNFEEVCAICLDTPTIGDSIRHLPCLHKFHKDCIDPWLSRRPLCPVCKSTIT